MRLVFVDTGALYALADSLDPGHAAAAQYYRDCELPLLTTDFIVAETMSLMTKRLSKRTAVAFGEALRASSRLRIEEVTTDVREAAWKLFSTRLDKDYDLIDCISFSVMESLSIQEAFGFDRHFAQYGFRLVPDR